MIGEGKVITETGERKERGEEKDTPTTNWRIHQLTIRHWLFYCADTVVCWSDRCDVLL